MRLSAVVLAVNEARHIERCLSSITDIAHEVVVVDSGSSDGTLELARSLGARTVSHPFVNHSAQFNWALTQLPPDTDWVLRIDADEYLTPELVAEIASKLPTLGDDVDGVFVPRSMVFQGRLIRHGGVGGVQLLRLFRYGRGRCENRWMDEHIKVDGGTVSFDGALIDHNLNSLTWWTEKHNRYASREAVDLLNLEYGFMPQDSVASLRDGSQAGAKRWMKEKVYARLPGGLRAFAYFAYRYVIRLGFLDGRAGATFHFLQGWWYRTLVDAKVAEVKRHMRETGDDARAAIRKVLDLAV